MHSSHPQRNDVGWYNPPPYPVADQAEDYEASMRAVADALIAKGIIPLLTTMPPRQGYESYVPVYSGVVRAIAQGRQIPLIDYNRELSHEDLPHPVKRLQRDEIADVVAVEAQARMRAPPSSPWMLLPPREPQNTTSR